jgi:hypothetical protein
MEDMWISGAATIIAGAAVFLWNSFAQSQKNLSKFQLSKAQQDWLEEQAERGIRYVYEQVFKENKKVVAVSEGDGEAKENSEDGLKTTFGNKAKLEMATDFVKEAAKANNINIPDDKMIHLAIESVLPVVRPELDKLFEPFGN